jgi:hypothetical protein
MIDKVEGLDELKKLNTLILKRNKLKDIDDLRGLLRCPSVR